MRDEQHKYTPLRASEPFKHPLLITTLFRFNKQSQIEIRVMERFGKKKHFDLCYPKQKTFNEEDKPF